MNKKKEIALGIGIIILIMVVGYFISPLVSSKSLAGKVISGNTIQVQLTRDNFNLFLQQQKVVQDLPSGAVISLRLYNFDSGQRVWEKAYTISKGKVVEGYVENSDLEIILSSKYIYELAQNMCTGVAKAKSNGDIAFDMKLSKTSFLWKYKSMLGYRSCFGF